MNEVLLVDDDITDLLILGSVSLSFSVKSWSYVVRRACNQSAAEGYSTADLGEAVREFWERRAALIQSV